VASLPPGSDSPATTAVENIRRLACQRRFLPPGKDARLYGRQGCPPPRGAGFPAFPPSAARRTGGFWGLSCPQSHQIQLRQTKDRSTHFGHGGPFILTQNWPLPANRTRLELDFETLILFKIFDRNPNVRFHKSMLATGRQNSPVHDPAHSQLFNISQLGKISLPISCGLFVIVLVSYIAFPALAMLYSATELPMVALFAFACSWQLFTLCYHKQSVGAWMLAVIYAIAAIALIHHVLKESRLQRSDMASLNLFVQKIASTDHVVAALRVPVSKEAVSLTLSGEAAKSIVQSVASGRPERRSFTNVWRVSVTFLAGTNVLGEIVTDGELFLADDKQYWDGSYHRAHGVVERSGILYKLLYRPLEVAEMKQIEAK
jgi:hypothetical protein